MGLNTVRWTMDRQCLTIRNSKNNIINSNRDRERDSDRISNTMTTIVGVGAIMGEEEVDSITIHMVMATTTRIVSAVISVGVVIAAIYAMTAVPVSMWDVVPFARFRCTVSMDLEIVSVRPLHTTLWAITMEIAANAVMHAVAYWDAVILRTVARE